MYIRESNSNKVPGTVKTKYHFKNTTFESNKAFIGGALYLDNP